MKKLLFPGLALLLSCIFQLNVNAKDTGLAAPTKVVANKNHVLTISTDSKGHVVESKDLAERALSEYELSSKVLKEARKLCGENKKNKLRDAKHHALLAASAASALHDRIMSVVSLLNVFYYESLVDLEA